MYFQRLINRLVPFIFLLFLGLSLTTSVAAEVPYDGYIYDKSTSQQVVAAPNGYLPERIIQASDFELSRFLNPQDLFVSSSGELYVLDSGNNRVVVLNSDLTLKKVVDTFLDADGQESLLNDPRGIFVARDGRMIIADYGNQRVLVTDSDGVILRVLNRPKTDLLEKEWVFSPLKVVEDSQGLIYVLADRLVDGALVFDTDNTFIGFFGSNAVVANSLQAFWKKVMSSVQLSYMMQTVPTESSNYFIDDKDFVYTVTATGKADSILVQKCNSNGSNVLDTSTVYGDLISVDEKRFVDITVDDDGFLYVLDEQQGKIYMHNTDGILLSVFGGIGEQKGTFKSVASLVHMGDKILVLDDDCGTITVFAPTNFILDVRQALLLYNDGLFVESLEPWEKVLQQDTNYYMANFGIGKAMYMQGNYQEAMRYYKQTYASTEEYSEAFKEYRRLCIQVYLIPAAAVLIVVLTVFFVVKKIVRSRRPIAEKKHKRKEFFPVTVMLHPFESYNRIKYSGDGSVSSAVVVLLLFMASNVLLDGEKSYIHNANYGALLNIPLILLSCLAVFLLFTIANWAICTLTEGKGKYIEIFKTTAYALLPYTLFSFATVGLSYCLTADESSFLGLLGAVGVLWSAVLLLIGLQTIHMYTMGKTISSCLLTILGMAIIIFIATVFYSLIYQVYMFINTIIYELQIRG